MANTTIYANGIFERDLCSMLIAIKTKFNAVLVKLDADNLSDSDYNSTLALSYDTKHLSTKAVRDQGTILKLLKSWVTNFNLLLAKLDADTVVNSTNYASTCAMTPTISVAGYPTKPSGLNQSQLVWMLNHGLTKFNAMNAKLDADTGVAATNYVSTCNITDTVKETGSSAN